MLYRPSSLRKSSLLVTATAATLFAGASMATTRVAYADEPSNKFVAACASITDANKHAACMVDQIDKHTQQLKAEGDAAEAISGCVKFLTAGVKSGAFNKSEILEKAKGKLNDQNACPIAKEFGFGRKAEISSTPRL